MNKNVDANNVAARIENIFAKHPDRDKLFASSDGQLFFEEDHAIGQGKNLKFKDARADDSVLTIHRAEFAALMGKAKVGKVLLEALQGILTPGENDEETAEPGADAGGPAAELPTLTAKQLLEMAVEAAKNTLAAAEAGKAALAGNAGKAKKEAAEAAIAAAQGEVDEAEAALASYTEPAE